MNPKPCPFCDKEIDDDEERFHYNGFGPPPSYSVQCGWCGARGPSGLGRQRGDEDGARASAIQLWNEAARPHHQTLAAL